MAFPLKRRIYEAMPTSLQSLVRLAPFGLWAGRSYRKTLARGRRLDRASAEEIRSYQSRRLAALLEFAVEQVPAYQSLAGVVGRLSPFEALKAFPLLDKDTLQRDMPRYLPRCLDKIPHYEISTGGTSGNQLKLLVDDDYQATELGFMHRQWARVGYRPGDRKATFRGVQFGPLPEGVYWQTNPIYNELQFSPFHMSERTMGLYVDRLARFRPRYLHGYPSAIAMLAEFIIRHRLRRQVKSVRAALLASEGPLCRQREAIEEAFNCTTVSWYGHSERGLLAVECGQSDGYHAVPDYGIAEILDPDRADVPDGHEGELVATGLQNRSLPLIRYRTGDTARRCDKPCPCARAWQRLTEVKGHRGQDHLIGRDGQRLTLAALNMHGPLFERVVRFQYAQQRPGRAELRLMTRSDFTRADLEGIRKAYACKTRGCLDLDVRVVENIALTARGKYRMLEAGLEPDTQLELKRCAS
jgi:phenylacetate-CoA ligase